MKRIISAVMAITLIVTLCACGANTSGASSAQPPASGQQQEGRGDIFEEQVPDGADVLTQGVYYYELVEFSGDYGNGLSPREGAELTNDLLASKGLYSDNGGIPAEQCVYISLDELAVLDSAMGRECYIYSVGIGSPAGGLMGDDYQVVYRISVDYSGNQTAAIYEDFSSEYTGDGRGDMIVSDMSEDLPYWSGFDFGQNLSYDAEYETEGDPGPFLNPAEAAKLTFDTMRDNGNMPEYGDDMHYTMTLVDLTDIEGEECYVYRLDVDSSNVIGAAYAYAYTSGNIYMQGLSGQWVIPE